jgi:nifR3 family TIM-barrel protein
MTNIWQKLTKKKEPFFILAPMAGVTDSPFRRMIVKIGKPDLFFTEFVSTEHIVRVNKIPDVLRIDKSERPIIAQFFGCKPEQFRVAAKLALKLKFDGIDINMGCPDRKVQKQGSGSELIKNPKLMREIIRVVREVVGDKVPVSIKVRLGYEKKDIRDWILDILEEGIDAVTIHGRTAKQGYTGEADWEAIGEIAKEIKKRFPNIIVIGNGDVKSIEMGKQLAKKYGVDGVMIGREALHNPWVFSGKKDVGLKIRSKLALEHTQIFEKFYGPRNSFGAMKKYYKAYFSGVSGELFPKKELMDSKSAKEAKKILS